MPLRAHHLLTLLALILLTAPLAAQSGDLAISAPPDTPRRYAFSNKLAAFWLGETQQANRVSHQGYTILEQRYLRDYRLLSDGEDLQRSEADRIVLHPDRLVRDWPGLRETFFFLDSINAVLIRLEATDPRNLDLIPVLDPLLTGLDWRWDGQRQVAGTRLPRLPEDKPRYMAVSTWGTLADTRVERAAVNDEVVVTGDGNRRSRRIETVTRQELDRFRLEGLRDVHIAIVFGADSLESDSLLDHLRNDREAILKRRAGRVARLLDRAALDTGRPELDRAYAWSLIAMDDLVTAQRGEGIWAGLPWFNNYWGRDSFITLPGALLVTGQFETARRVLLSFARFQNENTTSPFYGRIPNRVMLNEVIYNTTDGTPWFVRACEQYVRYSGDSDFIGEIFPVIKRATDGAIRNHLDEYGFLTHADAETWMDAVGTAGPWSPRGNRAVEIQVLWMEQLRIAIDWAERLGYKEWAADWRLLYNRVRSNFPRYFWDPLDKRLVDHLNSDNTRDEQVRPNAIFAVTLPERPLLDSLQRARVISEVTGSLLFPWGVASLAQTDANFHPYHHYPPYYVPDAAYHNGIIWTWVNGPVLSALMPHRPDLAFRVMIETARQVLEEDAIGSYSELLEAWPRPGEAHPRISGTVSQAWNLAEYLRNWHADLFGLRPDLTANRLTVAPSFPADLDSAALGFRLGGDDMRIRIVRSGERWSIDLDGNVSNRDLEVVVDIPVAGRRGRVMTTWNPGQPLRVVIASGATAEVGGARVPVTWRDPAVSLPADLALAQPRTDLAVPALKGPDYDLIDPDEVVIDPGRLTPLLFDISDPEGDDTGPEGEAYVYPRNPNFAPGIFDARRVRIWRSDAYFHFEVEMGDLVDPGWKPEAGFQLTYLALTLSFEKLTTLKRTRVEMNANYSLPIEYAYHFIIYVGNGYRIVDSRGNIIAEYQPVDTAHPIGFADEKKIRFSVPVHYLADRHLRNAALLVGGQDDHGGGGVGEFRAVLDAAGEWNGGGGQRPDGNPNVYDVVLIRR